MRESRFCALAKIPVLLASAMLRNVCHVVSTAVIGSNFFMLYFLAMQRQGEVYIVPTLTL